jgi:hypothetical protein
MHSMAARRWTVGRLVKRHESKIVEQWVDLSVLTSEGVAFYV